MPLNIPALRATQRSILNLDNPFHMHCWCCCIAGHALRANGIRELNHLEAIDFSVAGMAMQVLGLDIDQQTLFCEVRIGTDRERACARINELIEAEARKDQIAAAIKWERDFSDFSQEHEEELVTA